MPRGSKPGERRGGRKKGSPNKKTEGRAMLAKVLEVEKLTTPQLAPATFLLDVMQTEIPKDAAPQIQAATMHMKVEAGKALLPYFHYRKGEEREPPPEPPPYTGDEKEITYDAARRVLFALAVLERSAS